MMADRGVVGLANTRLISRLGLTGPSRNSILILKLGAALN